MPGESVLIVEDNDILREGLAILLEAESFQVLSAPDGVEALAVMQTTSPDIILSDISMPRMDGFEFYNAVREHPEWVTIPFIFLTARSERDDLFASKKLGAEDYLVKPIDRQELVMTIRSRLDRSQQLLLAQLEQAYEASLIMLSNAIELRDQYTRGHVERVMEYSLLIAAEMGWTPAQMKPLQFGAILHDIGKIYIRESILSKAGPLEEAEWAEMRNHTAEGAELLRSIPYLSLAIPIIRHHHERWDGLGYPDGIAGEQIPLGARIVAVADSFDAMTSMRIYQKAVSDEEAAQEIEGESGARYDPQVVNAFLAVYRRKMHPEG
jgi:putative two-component system response regulator